MFFAPFLTLNYFDFSRLTKKMAKKIFWKIAMWKAMEAVWWREEKLLAGGWRGGVLSDEEGFDGGRGGT